MIQKEKEAQMMCEEKETDVCTSDAFQIVGIREILPQPVRKEKWYRGKPVGSAVILALLIAGCMGCRLVIISVYRPAESFCLEQIRWAGIFFL